MGALGPSGPRRPLIHEIYNKMSINIHKGHKGTASEWAFRDNYIKIKKINTQR